MVTVSLRGVTKRFNDVIAVNDARFDIADGELFTLLGPSGCGKTTLLRCIAGFYIPEEGTILFDDLDVTNVPPNLRETGMVFQNYALWPHMSVFDNIGYGLKIRKMHKDAVEDKVLEILDLVQLTGLAERYPYQLSGGQQQRVALARALVIEPKVLLLDEPLSNLDAKLRIEMRNEISRIQKRLDITTIYVTHDQEEALAISDRLAVIDNGVVQQIGTPHEIYSLPRNLFVADFIGECNIIKGTVTSVDGALEMKTEEGYLLRGFAEKGSTEEYAVGETAYVAMRPENIRLTNKTPQSNVIPARVRYSQYFGKVTRLFVDGLGTHMKVDADPGAAMGVEGTDIELYVEPSAVLFLPRA